MKKPVVGVIGNTYRIENRFAAQVVGERNLRALAEVSGALPVIFADRHEVTLTPGGAFARLLGCEKIKVNSLHGQGILEPGKRVVIEGIAEDGTIEANRIAEAPTFALGVQWHAEYDPQRNPINRKLFEAFGAALKAHERAS